MGAMLFVELWTLQKGILKQPRVLDADGQAAAFARWERDEPRRFDTRELAAPEMDCTVQWKKEFYEQNYRELSAGRLASRRPLRMIGRMV